VLDVMLEYFNGGKRWMRGELRDASGEHRCLIGALRECGSASASSAYSFFLLRLPGLPGSDSV
jgi:hypothetical protein